MGDALPTGWMSLARCKGNSTFATLSYSEKADDLNRAKRFCSGCDVRHDCLSYALLIREPFGVWGGRTAPERRKMWKYGSAFSGFQDELRHQLIVSSPEPEPSSDPTTWDWSI